MNATYEDITIVDLDLKKTTWSRVHSSMRTLFLKLSREPEIDWIRFFNEERESRVVPTRHGLWIEDGYIVFDCLLRNVETLHLPDFRLSVAYANEHARLKRARNREEVEQLRVDEGNERDLLATLRTLVRDEPTFAGASPASDAVVDSPAPSAVDAESAAQPVVASPPDPIAANDGFDARRDEWRTRFRNAMNARNGTERDKK